MTELIIALLIISITLSITAIVILIMFIRRQNNTTRGEVDSYIDVVQGFSEQTRESIMRNESSLEKHISTVTKFSNDTLNSSISELAKVERENANSLREQLFNQLSDMRSTVNRSLTDIKEDNNKQLENIRQIVDKTLVDTLEIKLNKSYEIISNRLEEVAKGFGQLQHLASGVSDLKQVLTNVKTRGVWGEIMLGNLLEQMLTSEQYKTQFMIDGSEQVDFAVILPGKNNDSIYLPIDAKFPDASYQRMIDSYDKPAQYEQAVKELVGDIKKEAKSISAKYIKPPITTDFAIMYLPTEGLFAEVVKRGGLVEEIQNKHRIMIAGPTTLAALLSSLQMGFKTLAIEKRSMEIRNLLVNFKMEFVKFADLLDQTQKRIDTVSKSIESATRKTRTISKKLLAVESIADISDEELLDKDIS